MLRLTRHARLCGLAGALCALAAASARAQLVVPTITPSGPLYHYDYTITDNTATEFVDFALNVAPGAGTIQNLTAPTGFKAIYDSGLGLVDFVGDTNAQGGIQDFTPGGIFSGFTFDSPLAPQLSTYTAYDTSLNPTPGTTLAPQSAAVPEPGTLALALLAVPGLTLIAARRRRAPQGETHP